MTQSNLRGELRIADQRCEYLTLTGTSALSGTGNALTDLIVGNAGNDTLTGGTGIAVLEGGTAGSDQLKAASNQAALIGGAGASTLTGGAYKDFYAAGKVSDSLTTGATANVVSINKGDGATALQPTTGASNVLSLGAGIDTESLTFTKSGNNLVLTDGVSGDAITFGNWYAGSADQDFTTLQVVEIASASYNASGTDALRNKALEDFNFSSLVSQFNAVGSPANWALSGGMPSAQLTSSATTAYGGDLAYYFGLNGNLTGMDLSGRAVDVDQCLLCQHRANHRCLVEYQRWQRRDAAPAGPAGEHEYPGRLHREQQFKQ